METTSQRPGFIGRLRSRQSGLPSGVLGRIFGRAMVGTTADHNDQALALLDLRHPRTVLDIGFGQGRTVGVLLEAGHEVLGVDASPTMVKQATARNRSACKARRATLRLGDGVTIPFADQTADAAITVHTVYFMPDPASTFADIARVLRPDGILIVACRTRDTPTPAWMDPATYRVPTADDLESLLRDAGFIRVERHTTSSPDHDLYLFVAHLPRKEVTQ